MSLTSSKRTELNGKRTRHIPKWGFGMAKISPRMRTRYDKAVQSLLDLNEGRIRPLDIDPNDISELKGMLNRCIRQDQWDWFSVYSEIGRPPERLLRAVVSRLTELRKSVVGQDGESTTAIVSTLSKTNILKSILFNYQTTKNTEGNENESGWLYILSTREHPNYLKIGITQRDVDQRVREINSATGVLVPYSVRACFPVTDPRKAERIVFDDLAPFRIRNDREFFDMQFKDAVKSVRQLLDEARLIERPKGTIAWFSEQKGYGFVTSESGIDIFLHVSEIRGDTAWLPKEGDKLDFDIGVKGKGLAALNAKSLAGHPSTSDFKIQQCTP